MKVRPFLCNSVLSLVFFFTLPIRAEVSDADLAPIQNWLQFQRGIRTVAAEFVQMRELRTLRNPLRSEGKVWIDRKRERFRWQSGSEDSPKAVAVKSGDTLTLMQPSRKRARQVDLGDAAGDPAGAAFDFAAGDLPDSLADLKTAFSIEKLDSESGAWRLTLRPLQEKLRESVAEIVFVIDAERFFLRGFEMTFRDRSVVKTTFTRQEFNLDLDDSLFEPDLSSYTLDKS
ncbi:MAG: outer membrane lipoprotein carrier protein LolA [Verrucomicrobiae bacterium]|nr:outer membrane lipoprotein carrier protein LolA [Verrucomicrobiae bacterium]